MPIESVPSKIFGTALNILLAIAPRNLLSKHRGNLWSFMQRSFSFADWRPYIENKADASNYSAAFSRCCAALNLALFFDFSFQKARPSSLCFVDICAIRNRPFNFSIIHTTDFVFSHLKENIRVTCRVSIGAELLVVTDHVPERDSIF